MIQELFAVLFIQRSNLHVKWYPENHSDIVLHYSSETVSEYASVSVCGGVYTRVSMHAYTHGQKNDGGIDGGMDVCVDVFIAVYMCSCVCVYVYLQIL